MPCPYLIQVFSQPHEVSPEIWIQWYLEEHIRDMVYFGVAKKAAFYRASSDVLEHLVPPNDGNNGRSFLTLFHTDQKDALSCPEFREKVRQTTQRWGGKRGREVGEFKNEQVSLIEGRGSSDSYEGMIIASSSPTCP